MTMYMDECMLGERYRPDAILLMTGKFAFSKLSIPNPNFTFLSFYSITLSLQLAALTPPSLNMDLAQTSGIRTQFFMLFLSNCTLTR